MTKDLKSMLEELKKLDEETWIEIENSESDINYLDLDIVQGCIQRSIKKRGWGAVVEIPIKGANEEYRWSAYLGTSTPPGAFRFSGQWSQRSYGDSPASTLLAAYLKALRTLNE